MKMKKKNSFTIKKYVISLNLYVREIKTGLYKNVTKCVRTNPSTMVLGFVFYLNPSNQILVLRKQKQAIHISKEFKLYELRARADSRTQGTSEVFQLHAVQIVEINFKKL